MGEEVGGGDGARGGGDAAALLGAAGGAGVRARDGGVPGVSCAGAFDELCGPVSGAEEGVGPLEERDGGAVEVGVDEVFGAEEALAEGDHGEVGADGPGRSEGIADAEEIIEDVLDGRWIEGDHSGWTGEGAREALDGRQVDGADFAEILGQDEVGSERGEERLVHGVQGLSGLEGLLDGGVDRGGVGRHVHRAVGREVGPDPGGGEDGDGVDGGWEVTLM